MITMDDLKAVELALVEKGQASKRYKLDEIWELNLDEIREALATVPSIQPKSTRTFVELVVKYPDPELCTYKEYKGKPYYSIKYIENGEMHIGYGTYDPKILSQYLKEYFIPSVQPEQQWIPVSERLPEKSGRYCVTRGSNAVGALWNRVYIVNYSDLMGLKNHRIWWTGNVGKSDFEQIDDVLAWMSLPKPYKEERK